MSADVVVGPGVVVADVVGGVGDDVDVVVDEVDVVEEVDEVDDDVVDVDAMASEERSLGSPMAGGTPPTLAVASSVGSSAGESSAIG